MVIWQYNGDLGKSLWYVMTSLYPLAPQVSRLKSRPPRVKALKDSEELKLLGERGEAAAKRQECPTKILGDFS